MRTFAHGIQINLQRVSAYIGWRLRIQIGLAVTHIPFTHAGTVVSHDGVAGGEQVAQELCALESRFVFKLLAVELGIELPQLQTQELLSGTMIQSELFPQPVEPYLLSRAARSAA